MTGWVCLMYHDVTLEPASERSAAYFSVPVQAFATQLELLRSAGYTGRALGDFQAAPLPPRAVGISFDDGDLGQYRHAFPELVKRGMTATFFVTTDWVGRPGHVSWEGLREMRAAGMSVQSHTCSHPFLSELSQAEVQRELRTSREVLNHHLDQETDTLALPGGDFPRGGPLVFRRAGYRIVATSHWGVNSARPGAIDEIAFVHRCTVRGEPPREEFEAVVSGNRWLGARRRVREIALNTVRATLTPTRYQRWRRAFLRTTHSTKS